ncbi:hypothetical protein B7494_g7721 [Chlorociboria aeruginascens]|nr:hypothetical protein B7494_g7721 [Chlorociboria aeruginascens]
MSTTPTSSEASIHPQNENVLGPMDSEIQEMAHKNHNMGHQIAEAKDATDREHDISMTQILRLHKKAIAYSLIFSTSIIMEGYDTALMGSFFGFPPFQNRFGTETDMSPDEAAGAKIIAAGWQTAILIGAQTGQLIGLGFEGWIVEKIGFRKTMLGFLTLMAATILIPFFSPGIEMFLVGSLLEGIPWGAFQAISITYASDVAPVKLRPLLTTYTNLCWVLGQLIAAGVVMGLLNCENQWAYRVPFALQWVWIPPLVLAVLIAPESPWWLLRQKGIQAAEHSLRRLTSEDSKAIHNRAMMMQMTDEFEKSKKVEISYLACFQGIDLRRTENSIMAFVAQSWCGPVLISLAPQIYKRAGLNDSNTYSFNVGQSGLGALGTILSWFLMQYIGRRKIYLWGLSAMAINLALIGGLDFVQSGGAPWAIGILLMVYTFLYDLTVGPVCYCLVSEIPSSRLKIKTVAIARCFYNLTQIINSGLVPQMLSPNAWNWGPKTGLLFAGLCVVLYIWSYFRLVEPKGRTFGELDILFDKEVSARKFAAQEVSQFSDSNTKSAGDRGRDGEGQSGELMYQVSFDSELDSEFNSEH